MIEDTKKVNWLEDALDFDVHIGSDAAEVKEATEYLFKEVSSKLPIRNKARSKETLKNVLTNLWVGVKSAMPIKYSRNRNDYRSPKRYGKLFFKYKRLIPIIDTLEGLGYVHQRKGFYDRAKNISRQTRIYATPKLIQVFFDFNFPAEENLMHKTEHEEPIQLKNKEKRLIDYPETDLTVEIRENLAEYNEFIGYQTVMVEVPNNVEVPVKFLRDLFIQIQKGRVTVNHVELANHNLDKIVLSIINNTEPINSISNLKSNNNNEVSLPNFITQHLSIPLYYTTIITSHHHHTIHHPIFLSILSTMTKTLRTLPKDERNRILKKKIRLIDCGIARLNLTMKYKSLHRTFNRSSFERGGRFYGAYHLELPRDVRKYGILLDGNAAVESDYSAHHVRMLYHLERIPYADDPYVIGSSNEKERKLYKIVQLVAINAANEKEAIQAIRKEFRQNGIVYDLTDKAIGTLLETFAKTHTPISKYLNTGIGLRLQNLDSIITEAILTKLTREGVACLPVHDSYIVEERYKELLLEKMNEEYEKAMKFPPVIG